MPCVSPEQILGYDEMGQFQLNHEDMESLGASLKNTLIPYEQLQITGDLGEGELIVLDIAFYWCVPLSRGDINYFIKVIIDYGFLLR